MEMFVKLIALLFMKNLRISIKELKLIDHQAALIDQIENMIVKYS